MGQGELSKLCSGLDINALKNINLVLESLKKNSVNGADKGKDMATTLEILHASCKARILSLADKFAANQVPKSIRLLDEPVELEIPEEDSWDFKLGDWVRIRYSMSEFRSIQSRTLGWHPRLSTIHSFDAVVTKRWSSFENGVNIYTPAMLSVDVVFAGLLQKITDSERVKENVLVSRWKVNDYVMIASDDDRALKILQEGLDTISEKLLRRRGRIIAVTEAAIMVTFNERTSVRVNSAILTKCQVQERPLYIHQRDHEEGFGIGAKCKVISDIRKLVEYQSPHHGGWSADMTKFAGKQVTIIHIKKSGSLIVQYKNGGFWRMNPKCLVSLETNEKEDYNGAPSLKRGDIVNVKLIENIRDAIHKTKVPTAFLEYLRITAELRLVDVDLDCVIKYNCNQQVNVLASTLRHATEDEKEKHNKVKTMVKNLKIGSSVFLDVGPPSYVNAVLQGFSIPSEVARALTTPSILVGYECGGKAVIEYEDGLRYKIEKKYLTVPEKYNMQSSRNGPSLEIIKTIEENIKDTVVQKDNLAGETAVKIISMSFDSSPFIDFRVYSDETSIDDISENLIDLDFEVKPGFDNWFYVSGLQCFEREIKISIYFNDEPYLHNFTEFGKTQTPSNYADFAQTEEKHTIPVGGSSSDTRKKSLAVPICGGLQSHDVQTEDVQERDPGVITIRGYKYLRLSDSVYLPLCIGLPNGELFTSENAAEPPTMINLNVSNSMIPSMQVETDQN